MRNADVDPLQRGDGDADGRRTRAMPPRPRTIIVCGRGEQLLVPAPPDVPGDVGVEAGAGEQQRPGAEADGAAGPAGDAW